MLTRDELRVGESYVSAFGDDKNNKRTILAIGDSKIFYKCPQTDCEYLINIDNALRHWCKIPVRHKGWMNLYPNNSSSLGVLLYSSKKEADDRAIGNRIACIEIEFEEGQGL